MYCDLFRAFGQELQYLPAPIRRVVDPGNEAGANEGFGRSAQGARVELEGIGQLADARPSALLDLEEEVTLRAGDPTALGLRGERELDLALEGAKRASEGPDRGSGGNRTLSSWRHMHITYIVICTICQRFIALIARGSAGILYA